MSQERKCEKCNQPMHQIGPFATQKKEGEAAEKWDGSIDHQCVNPECDNYAKIITI